MQKEGHHANCIKGGLKRNEKRDLPIDNCQQQRLTRGGFEVRRKKGSKLVVGMIEKELLPLGNMENSWRQLAIN